MSTDYYIHLKQLSTFSTTSFEEYCNSLGLCVAVHPSFNIFEHSGYVPMRFVDERFSNAGGPSDFLSGFELFLDEYNHEIQPKKPKGFFQKLFLPKAKKDNPFDITVKDFQTVIVLNCSSSDSFEILLAHVFGAYFVKCFGGVFDDPQSGQFYDDSKHLEAEIATIVEELSQQATAGELLTHTFDGWL